MVGLTKRRVGGHQTTGLRISLPTAWVRALNLVPGDSVEVVYDDVLIVIPKLSPQATRVRRAMAEEG